MKGSTVRVALIEPGDATPPSVSKSDVTPTVCRTDNKVVRQKETPKTTRYLPFSDKWVLDHVQNGTYEQGLTQLRVWAPKMQRALNTWLIDDIRRMDNQEALKAI